MASDTLITSTGPSLQVILETGEDQASGKRRRNRARVSCISCYASKRKCDRRRPCSRCIKLGLTGLCVYEIDDPALRKRELDETTHLKNRIAELESVLRQLKRKPHPRWTAPGGITHDPGLVAVSQRTDRGSRADSIRSASVETFFAAIAESADEGVAVKVKQESSFVPEFTPSELEYPGGESANAHPSPLLIPTPFDFGEDVTRSETSLPDPPLSSFIQTVCGDSISLSSPKSQAVSIFPNPSSVDGHTALSSLVDSQRDSPGMVSLTNSSPTRSVDIVQDTVGIRNPGIQTVLTPSPTPTGPSEGSPSVKGKEVCQCLNATALVNPLLHLSIALRTSREALQGFHPSASDCDLFRRIVELEEHIFSAPPSTPESIPALPQDCGNECNRVGSALHPTLELSPVLAQLAIDPPVTQSRVSPCSFPPFSIILPPPALGHHAPYFFPHPHPYELHAASHLVEPSFYAQLQE